MKLLLLSLAAVSLALDARPADPGPRTADLKVYLAQRLAEFDQIDASRQEVLDLIAGYIRKCEAKGHEARLVFICTHNSRRSQLAQVWAAIAAGHFGLEQVRTFSGGTEATAFNPRAVEALRRAGVNITVALSSAENPVHLVQTSAAVPLHSHAEGNTARAPLVCFSKRHDSAPNPAAEFCAVFACTDADEACPTVSGSDLRIALPFTDPKSADGTPAESATYDDRSAQICREMLYLMSRAVADENGNQSRPR